MAGRIEQALSSLPGGGILVACSGGRDSMVMLHGLCRGGRWPIQVVTVDHGLRPEAAEEARWVVGTARRWGCPAAVEVASLALPGAGVEGAARAARYAILEGWAARVGARHIVTAHTAEDQVETVLMRLDAGAGLQGLRGVLPTRGRVVRPLLGVPRDAIAEYAERHGVPWVEDPSNQSHRFSRNRLRHLVLPALGEALSPGWPERFARSAARCQTDHEALDYFSGEWLRGHGRAIPGGLAVPVESLDAVPTTARRILLKVMWGRVTGGAPPRGCGRHLDALAEMSSEGSVRQLPGGLWAQVHRGHLEISRERRTRPARGHRKISR